MKCFKKLCLVLLSVQAIFSLNAQFDFDYNQLKQKYSKFNAIVLEKKEEVLIDIIDGELKASQHTIEQVLIFNDHSKAFSNDRVYTSGFTAIAEIDARTFIPKSNGKYKSLKVTEFKEIDDMRGYVFYDDSKAITFTFPALQEGAITSLEYTTVFKDPRFLHSYIFKSFTPVLETSLTIKVNKNIEIKHKGFHLDNFDYDFSKTEKGDYIYYKWTAENLEAYKIGGDRINVMHYSPHIVYYVGNISVNGLSKRHYGTVEDLYKFYLGFIENVDTSCNNKLKKKVDEIIAGITNEEEKVKQILYWVRENIKYIAFEQGTRGFIPNDGSTVFNNKYGDCKDMSSLIVTMLNCAGIKGHITWTGTRHIPYSYEELPLLKTDNHMVAVYMKDNKPVILDGTIGYLSYGFPPYLLQDKELLISFDPDNYIIYKVPVLSPEKSLQSSEYEVMISADTIKGKGKTSYGGYNRGEILYGLNSVKQSDLKKSLVGLLSVGSNKFDILDYNIEKPKEEGKPVSIEYNFEVPGYVKSIDNEIYINLNIDKSYLDFKIDTAITEVPLENDYTFNEVYNIKLEIPSGYEVEYLPKDISFEGDKFNFKISYRQNGNTIIQKKNICFNFLILEKDEFNEWNSFIAKLVEAYREVVVLNKK